MTMHLRKHSGTYGVHGWIAVALAIFFTGAVAMGAAAEARILTRQTVKQFVASFPDVRSIAVSHAADKGQNIADAEDSLAAVIQAVSDKSIAKKVDAAVQHHGFGSSGEWMSVAQSVGLAYAHIKSGGDDKKQRKIDKAIAKINKMDFLSDKQKQKLAKGVREQAGVLLDAPPPENIAAVEPMVGEIEAVMK